MNAEPQKINIDVVGRHVHTTITLEDGTRLRILMNEKNVVEVVMGYRDALAKLRRVSPHKVNKPQEDSHAAPDE